MTQRLVLIAAVFFMLINTAVFAADNNPHVLMKTSKGDIEIELFADKAPKSVANFLRYVDEDFYNDTIFHRVILGFMIQGGGFDADYNKKHTHDGVQNEADNGLKNKRGTLAMARTAAPHSATAQFFINLEDNKFLNHPGQDGWGYAVFGKVVKGMDVVNTIGDTRTGSGGPFPKNVPREMIMIKSVERIPSIQTSEK
ncbi:MAG: peptidylprolyl isomerase [gamma proteobacterium symbiont of Bathyaustriella thionipta]|nr:peptidylprolyl isomerase [gamma proteobacterium symbiont of Bathyaustriella thionipta]